MTHVFFPEGLAAAVMEAQRQEPALQDELADVGQELLQALRRGEVCQLPDDLLAENYEAHAALQAAHAAAGQASQGWNGAKPLPPAVLEAHDHAQLLQGVAWESDRQLAQTVRGLGLVAGRPDVTAQARRAVNELLHQAVIRSAADQDRALAQNTVAALLHLVPWGVVGPLAITLEELEPAGEVPRLKAADDSFKWRDGPHGFVGYSERLGSCAACQSGQQGVWSWATHGGNVAGVAPSLEAAKVALQRTLVENLELAAAAEA